MGVPHLKPRIAQLGARVAPMSWRAGLTTGQRGYDYRWQQARAEYLRAHPLCVRCRPRLVPATTVDHVEPHRGDERMFWDRGNWQALCSSCHSSHKQAQEAAEAAQGGPGEGRGGA